MLLDVLLVVSIVVGWRPQFSLEVEIRLPSMAVVLDVVGKGRTFNKRLINLSVSQISIIILQTLEDIECLFE